MISLNAVLFVTVGSGLIIPLFNDKMCHVNSLDNYRGITLIPIVDKLFELVMSSVVNIGCLMS